MKNNEVNWDYCIKIIKRHNNISSLQQLFDLYKIIIPYNMLDYENTSYYNKYSQYVTDNFIEKVRNSYYISENSLSNDNHLIIMLSALSFNFVQFIFVCFFYEIFKSKKPENNNRNNFAKFLNTVDLSTHFIGNPRVKNNNFKYLINIFKNNVYTITEKFEDLSNEPYTRFLQFVWNEYKIIKKIHIL